METDTGMPLDAEPRGNSGEVPMDVDVEPASTLNAPPTCPSTPVRANVTEGPSSLDDDTSLDEDSPSYRPPALVVSQSLVSKVQEGGSLTTLDRVDMLISGQLPFYMKGVFELLRTQLRTDGGAEALLAWAKVQDLVDGASVCSFFPLVKLKLIYSFCNTLARR